MADVKLDAGRAMFPAVETKFVVERHWTAVRSNPALPATEVAGIAMAEFGPICRSPGSKIRQEDGCHERRLMTRAGQPVNRLETVDQSFLLRI